MGEYSEIAWTDHTWNPWRGCTKYGPGCKWCYAEARDILYESGKGATEPAHFGKGKPRIRAVEATRNLPHKIAKMIRKGTTPAGQNKVFTLSLGDWADDEIDPVWREEMWEVIRQTPELRYLLVTKRAANVIPFLPMDWRQNFQHCGIILTTVTQAELDRDEQWLREVKQKTTWVGLSIEPQLEPVSITNCGDFLDWAITGGESLQGSGEPRPYDVAWARSLIKQGRNEGVAIFVKQLGSSPCIDGRPMIAGQPTRDPWSDPSRWPDDIRVRQFPEALR